MTNDRNVDAGYRTNPRTREATAEWADKIATTHERLARDWWDRHRPTSAAREATIAIEHRRVAFDLAPTLGRERALKRAEMLLVPRHPMPAHVSRVDPPAPRCDSD